MNNLGYGCASLSLLVGRLALNAELQQAYGTVIRIYYQGQVAQQGHRVVPDADAVGGHQAVLVG